MLCKLCTFSILFMPFFTFQIIPMRFKLPSVAVMRCSLHWGCAAKATPSCRTCACKPYALYNSHSNPYLSSTYKVAQYIHGYSLIKSFLQCFINSTRFSSSQCTASVQTLKYSHDKLRVQTATQRTASERMKPKLISIQSCKIIN